VLVQLARAFGLMQDRPSLGNQFPLILICLAEIAATETLPEVAESQATSLKVAVVCSTRILFEEVSHISKWDPECTAQGARYYFPVL